MRGKLERCYLRRGGGEAAGALDYRWMRAVLPDMLVGHGYHMGEESPALRRSSFG